MPFVKYYLPEAEIAVCLLENGLDADRLAAVGKILDEFRDTKRVLVVGSADFSHYLQPEEAARCDAETEKAITNGDLDTISRYLALINI